MREDKNLEEKLIEAIEKHPNVSSIKGTWVLMIPSYHKQLSDTLANLTADRIIKAIQENYLCIPWPDCCDEVPLYRSYIPGHNDEKHIGFLKITNPKLGQEWQIRPITHPLLQMNSMFRHLIVATKMYILFRSLKLSFSNINDPIFIKNEQDIVEVSFPKTHYTHSEIDRELWNIFISSISNFSLAFDESLDLLLPYIDENEVDNEFLDGVFIIKQLRNAFAHGIRSPYWVISKSQLIKYKSSKINFLLTEDGELTKTTQGSKAISFDPNTVNHTRFSLEDIGGFSALICLLKFLLREAEKRIDNFNYKQDK